MVDGQLQGQPAARRSGCSKIIMWLVGILGALILITAALAYIGDRFGKTPEEQIDAAINEDPRAAEALGIIRASFPTDYARMRQRFISAISANGDSGNLRLSAQAEMRTFLRAHLDDAAQAPSANLTEFRRTQVAALEAMQRESTERCAQAMMGNVDIATPPSDAAVTAMTAMVTAQVRAAAAGARSPAGRPTTARDADSRALFDGMRRNGASDADIERFVGPAGLGGASPADQCRIGLSFARGLQAMPTDAADRITAVIMAAS